MSTRLCYSLILIVLLGFTACTPKESGQKSTNEKTKNEVLVLGTVHGHHLTEDEYSIAVLTDLIRKINPDIILTEIPPDRFPTAQKEFLETDSISEPRVVRFPEYIDVIFPLSKEMNFEIIPTAGWTREMADQRSAQLKNISEDSSRADEWNQLEQAGQLSDSLITASGRQYDPYWINSDAYDELSEIELSVYNKLFNDELGPGGWDNINKAHFGNIAEALDKYTFKGKRILITYGAGHKGWFLKALKKREDIEILTLEQAVGR